MSNACMIDELLPICDLSSGDYGLYSRNHDSRNMTLNLEFQWDLLSKLIHNP